MNKMNFFKNIKLGRPATGQVIFWVIAVILLVSGFYFVRNIVSCWRITPLPGSAPSNCGTVLAGPSGPNVSEGAATAIPGIGDLPPAISAPESDLPPAWDGASRITVLLIGLDYRDYLANDGPPRSDTMILLTIDPLTKTAGALTIPRDMWVNIPGFGYGRINMAYFYGEGSKLPGGGPELARKTVEQFIGVPVQYYAQIDFNTFVEFIDLIGGIDIYSDEELRLDPVGSGKDKIKITCCGTRHLKGEATLAYVRFRKDKEGDVGRSKRQLKVVLAIRDKVLSPENFPVLLGKANQFYNEFSAGIKTNMPFDTALQLGVLARDIPVESIKQGVIDYTMVTLDDVILGGVNASIMKPMPDQIRVLRDDVFTSAGALSPLAAQNDATALMQADQARVSILNGSFSPGLDSSTGAFLQAQGVSVVGIGTADRAYDRTTIILHSGKLYTLKYFQALFGITESAQVLIQPDPAAQVDVEVRLGNDWANNNPMP